MKISKELNSLIGMSGNTKRVRTLKQARALIEAGWAEKIGNKWGIAEEDCHRPATPKETQLLKRAAVSS